MAAFCFSFLAAEIVEPKPKAEKMELIPDITERMLEIERIEPASEPRLFVRCEGFRKDT